MTYDGNKVISWVECLWRPDGAHLATAGDWYVTNPDRTEQLDAARYLCISAFDKFKSDLSRARFDGIGFRDLQRAFDQYNYNRQYQIYKFGIDKPKDAK